MKKNESIDFIIDKIYEYLMFYKQKKIKTKMKLINLIDEINKDNKLDININKLIRRIDEINIFNHNYMNVYKDNGIYFIELLEERNDKLAIETRAIFFSLLIMFNIFILIHLFDFLRPIIIALIFFSTLMLGFVLKTNKMSIIVHALFFIMFLNANNHYIIFATSSLIALSFILTQDLYKYTQKFNVETIQTIILFIMFVIIALLIVCYRSENLYIDAKSYIILKSIIISILFIYYIILNKFNIIQTTLFLIISFSIYNLISKIMQILNDQDIIFHPYNEVFNFDYSLLSIALTIIILSIPLITVFIKNTLNFGNLNKMAITIFLYFLIVIVIFSFYENYLISIFLILSTLYLFFNIILDGDIDNSMKNRFFTYFNRFLFLGNKNKNYKIIDYINYFYQPLEIEKKIKFNNKIYIENISITFSCFIIITSFIFNYKHIYHYKDTKENDICVDNIIKTNTTKEEKSYKIYQKDNSKYIYMIIEEKKHKEELKRFRENNKIVFESRYNNIKVNYYIIKESCINYNKNK